jgi:DNA polymerase-3 subunit gamma/tau
VSIAQGSNVDVLEMDAASNRGIDEARAIKESVRLLPISAKVKVYIIDEAHMLTTEAANALLKTLEEPPPKVMFILCTTEPDKLLDTVVSRCVRVLFRVPTLDEAVASLRTVVMGESLRVSDKALEKIARAAAGGLRDGRKILEQIFLSSGGDLGDAAVDKALGEFEDTRPEILTGYLLSKNTREALDFVNNLVQRGVSINEFVTKAILELRRELMANLARKNELLPIIEKLQWVYGQGRETAVEQLPLEVAIIELGGDGEVEKQPEPEKVTKEEKKINETKVVVSTNIEEKWGEILKTIKTANNSIEGLLRSTRIAGFDGKTLSLEVFYKFHKDKLATDKCKLVIEDAIAKVMGIAGARLEFNLSEKKTSSDVLGKVEEDIVSAAENIFKVQAV